MLFKKSYHNLHSKDLSKSIHKPAIRGLKKSFVWMLAIITSMSILTSCGGNTVPTTSDTPKSSSQETTSSKEEPKETEKVEATGDSDVSADDGTIYVDFSNPSEVFQMIAENDDPSFDISANSLDFIDNHQDYFPAKASSPDDLDNIDGYEECINFDTTYAHLAKNISKYDNELIMTYGVVIDIQEIDVEDTDTTLSYIHIQDPDENSYILYYFVSTDDILEGSEVIAIGLPLAMVTFENMNATYTEAAVCAGSYIGEYTFEE